MRPKFIPFLTIHCFILILILAAILFSQGCAGPARSHQEGPPYAPAGVLSSACIDVDGTVLGNVIRDSNVSLYETLSLNYSIIMSEIRTNRPVKWSIVNETLGFSFRCLPTGNYAFVIPTSSYDGAVGSPLPYEFDCENLSLEIAFQGGDHEYSVGAFSTRHTSKDKAGCDKSPVFCPRRGKLYRECPLEPG